MSHAMYFDRRPESGLLAHFGPGGPLSHVVDLVRSPEGQRLRARIDFRRADGIRKRGGVQLYFGRTSPLEVIGQPGGAVRCVADLCYRGMTPELFGRRFQPVELPALRTVIHEHLQRTAAAVNRSFFDGEAVAHAGLMRRYAIDYISGDPLLALDSEVRIGFRRKDGQPGSTWRKQFRAQLRARLGIAGHVDLPTKLDTLAWVNGPLACVEVKPEAGDIVRATVQAAAHVFAFRALVAQPGTELGSMLRAMILQKQVMGLLPPTVGNPADNPAIVAVVAAPDGRTDWLDHWRRETTELRARLSDLLVGLRFWRLANSGEILEQAEA